MSSHDYNQNVVSPLLGRQAGPRATQAVAASASPKLTSSNSGWCCVRCVARDLFRCRSSACPGP